MGDCDRSGRTTLRHSTLSSMGSLYSAAARPTIHVSFMQRFTLVNAGSRHSPPASDHIQSFDTSYRKIPFFALPAGETVFELSAQTFSCRDGPPRRDETQVLEACPYTLLQPSLFPYSAVNNQSLVDAAFRGRKPDASLNPRRAARTGVSDRPRPQAVSASCQGRGIWENATK